ncbi:MAG: hypothetical protein M1395_05180 [Bacteroidetes bacterium]|jgi:hypothetical protein|nr:hypothetical protein [Bacteroidota bacterium]
MNEKTIRWHVELIPPNALNVLDMLTAASVLNEFYLAGGTGLALASGHRRSRDFIDLYTVAQEFGLADLLRLFDRKYADTHYNRVHILKSLVYFDDAESEPMPDMTNQVTWEMVKEFFLSEVPKLL